MTDEADRLVSRIEALDTVTARNQARAERYQQMTEQLRQVEGSAISPDGVVSVVAKPGGTISSVTFTDDVREAEPDRLSALVTHTIAAAQADTARRQAEIVRENLGDDELLDHVLSQDQQIFGDEPPSDPGPAPGPARRARSRASRFTEPDDEDLSTFSVFEQDR